jgi:hypothetical protein
MAELAGRGESVRPVQHDFGVLGPDEKRWPGASQLGQKGNVALVQAAAAELLSRPQSFDSCRSYRGRPFGAAPAPPRRWDLVIERTCDYGHSDPHSRHQQSRSI